MPINYVLVLTPPTQQRVVVPITNSLPEQKAFVLDLTNIQNSQYIAVL